MYLRLIYLNKTVKIDVIDRDERNERVYLKNLLLSDSHAFYKGILK